MSLPLVIVNPASAGNSTRGSWPAIAADLATHFGPFNCAFTEGPGGGRVLAARAALEGRKFVIACGGDGTISEVANGILESGRDVELGILPSGTGGDFRRTLDIPARAADAARALRRGRARRIDVGRVRYLNHAGEDEARYLIGVASVGMSTDIISRVKGENARRPGVARSGRLKGRLTFAAAGARTTLSLPKTSVVVQLDDGPSRRLTVANFCVANARYFGGGMKVAPGALLDDGEFDVISIGGLSALKILTHAHKLYRGTHLDMDEVVAARAKVVTVRAERRGEEVALEIDGELPGRLPAVFEIVPKALRVRVP
ncbi:MAG TPA: diacylglycerol kinase family protein [Pyrinomonadaceae bacterium]|nr:diacylglycerol kinase family protein [Pyrinomonadaceae bacterium]